MSRGGDPRWPAGAGNGVGVRWIRGGGRRPPRAAAVARADGRAAQAGAKMGGEGGGGSEGAPSRGAPRRAAARAARPAGIFRAHERSYNG